MQKHDDALSFSLQIFPAPESSNLGSAEFAFADYFYAVFHDLPPWSRSLMSVLHHHEKFDPAGKVCLCLLKSPGRFFAGRLALVAVSGRPNSLTSNVAIGWLEIRTPTPPQDYKAASEYFFAQAEPRLAVQASTDLSISELSSVPARPRYEHFLVGHEHRDRIAWIPTF